MSSDITIATWEEYNQVIDEIRSKYEPCRFTEEWNVAIGSGWDQKQYMSLYADYVKSTQINLGPTDSATELKGKPLEKLVRYFLEKGGLARNIREICEHQRWQVDGQGLLLTENILFTFGEKLCEKMGFQLFVEAKNHTEPMTNEEFARHYQRMTDHECNVGVIASTSGYRIARGRGIARKIYHDYLRDIFHLLLTFHAFYEVLSDDKAPLDILREALAHTTNESYESDKELQEKCSPKSCHALAKSEYERIFA